MSSYVIILISTYKINKMNSGIYKITCTANQKIYVGSTYNFDSRFKTHRNSLKNNKHKNPYLQAAYNKYGEENFIYEIIEYCKEEDLLFREQYWMDLTECYVREKGFNNCVLSDRPLGYKHTEENKKIMSEKKKGIKQTSENIAKRMAGRKKDYKHSEETKDKMREVKLGDKNPRYGIKYTEEQKAIKVEKLLSVPRWNIGKNKYNDSTMARLAEKLKGRKVVNSIKCKLINILTNEEWIADSIIELSKVCPLSLSSLNRLKANKDSQTKLLKQYKLEIINES